MIDVSQSDVNFNLAPDKAMFISWERHTRTRALAQSLNVSLYEVVFGGGRAVRYFRSAWATLRILLRYKPSVVIYQNPSLVLGYLLFALRFILKYRLVADAHNSALFPFENRHKSLTAIGQWVLFRSDLVLVTNRPLGDYVADAGANVFILPDCIPDKESDKNRSPQSCRVTFVCTYASDEPFLEVIKAAQILIEQGLPARIEFTGKPPANLKQRNLPKNVVLLGFLSEEDYWNQLAKSDFILDLTTRENCLVCGAYEAAAVGVPGILSDTEVTRSLFSSGYVYTKNSAEEIAKAIADAYGKRNQLLNEIEAFSSKYREEWQTKVLSLLEELQLSAKV